MGLGFLMLFGQAFSQDSTNFFPVNDGDFIEYNYWDGGETYKKLKIYTIVDSTDKKGNVHITKDYQFLNPLVAWYKESYIIDTLNHVYQGDTTYLYYDFNAAVGQKWPLPGEDSAFVAYEYSAEIFYNSGVLTNVKAIDFSFGSDGYGEKIAEGIGLISKSGYLGYRIDAIGAKIGGVEYGLITNIRYDKAPIPKIFNLHQNYPNPFNPTTQISFNLEKDANVTLTVFDIQGKQIVQLVNGFKTAGFYNVNFEGKDLPSGIYFYKIKILDNLSQSQIFNETKRMLLIK